MLKYSQPSRKRVRALGVSEIEKFLSELSVEADAEIAVALPPVAGFRPDSAAGMERRKKFLAKKLGSKDAGSSKDDERDFKALYQVWCAWGICKLGDPIEIKKLIKTLSSDNKRESKNDDEASEDKALALFRSLRELSHQNKCSLENIERFYLFSPFTESVEISALISASKPQSRISGEEALATIPNRLATDEHQILELQKRVASLSDQLTKLSKSKPDAKIDLSGIKSDLENQSEALLKLGKLVNSQGTSFDAFQQNYRKESIANASARKQLEKISVEVDTRRSELQQLSNALDKLESGLLENFQNTIGVYVQKTETLAQRVEATQQLAAGLAAKVAELEQQRADVSSAIASEPEKVAEHKESGEEPPPWHLPKAAGTQVIEVPVEKWRATLASAAKRTALPSERLIQFDTLVRAGQLPILFGVECERFLNAYKSCVASGKIWRTGIDASFISLDDLWRSPGSKTSTPFAVACKAAEAAPQEYLLASIDDLDAASIGLWLPRFAQLLRDGALPRNLLVVGTLSGSQERRAKKLYFQFLNCFPFEVLPEPGAVAASIQEAISPEVLVSRLRYEPVIARRKDMALPLIQQLAGQKIATTAAFRAARIYEAALMTMSPSEAQSMAVEVAKLLSAEQAPTNATTPNEKSFLSIYERFSIEE